jgi:hypothetical protein
MVSKHSNDSMKDASTDNDSASAPPAYEDVTKSSTDQTTLGEVLTRRRAARIKQVIDDHIIPAIWDKCSDGISQIVISLDLLVDASVGKVAVLLLQEVYLLASDYRQCYAG